MSDSASPEQYALRILIVENNLDTLKYLQMYLEQLGHAVLTARTLMQGAAMIRSESPELIISDIGLPDGTGWDLLKLAQATRPIYGIAMSGYGMNADRTRSKVAGFRQHILKPFVPDELDALLKEAADELAAARAQS